MNEKENLLALDEEKNSIYLRREMEYLYHYFSFYLTKLPLPFLVTVSKNIISIFPLVHMIQTSHKNKGAQLTDLTFLKLSVLVKIGNFPLICDLGNSL